VYERTLNPMMDVSTVINTTSGNPLVLPRLTADVTAGGSVTAEAAAKTEGDPTISTVQLGAFKIAHITLWSQELDDDEVIGLRQLLANAISRPIGLGWGTFFTTGTGTVQPLGFLAATGGATNGGTAGGTTAPGQSYDTFFNAFDLIDLFYGLAAPYRQNASWMASNTALAKMHKFHDANGQLMWAPSLIPGQPDTFLGRPVYENPAMAAVASATKSVAVGDFSRYVIRDVSPMRIDISSEYKFNTDQLAIRVVTRRDGALVDTAAIRFLVSANT
jgi:HK97 family phage major capsid protein